jgi:hypothetical protein
MNQRRTRRPAVVPHPVARSPPDAVGLELLQDEMIGREETDPAP